SVPGVLDAHAPKTVARPTEQSKNRTLPSEDRRIDTSLSLGGRGCQKNRSRSPSSSAAPAASRVPLGEEPLEQPPLGRQRGIGVFAEGADPGILAQVDVDHQPEVGLRA